MNSVNVGGAPRKCSALLQRLRVTAPTLRSSGANRENHRKPSVHRLWAVLEQRQTQGPRGTGRIREVVRRADTEGRHSALPRSSYEILAIA